MSKKGKILLFLLIIIFVVLIYLIITTESDIVSNSDIVSSNKETASNQVKNDNYLEELKNNYKENVSKILSQYLKLADQSDFNIAKAESIKDELLGLKMPVEYKDLHFSLILAINKMESYLLEGDEQIKIASRQIINQAKANYKWLDKYDEDIQ